MTGVRREPGEIRIEVVAGDAVRQRLVEVTMPATATVADAISAAGIDDEFPDLNTGDMRVGVWGKVVERSDTLRDGDRVELYRPLVMDPREARRLRAKADR